VCLARALLRDTPVLLLDEPGEHLDTPTADALLADALAAAGPRAVTVVSHRLAALVDVDEILVVADGRVVERGSHADLLAADGWYAMTWRDERAADDAVG
jgi:ABC-type multidrug transport system fused ATPase/permease subunit